MLLLIVITLVVALTFRPRLLMILPNAHVQDLLVYGSTTSRSLLLASEHIGPLPLLGCYSALTTHAPIQPLISLVLIISLVLLAILAFCMQLDHISWCCHQCCSQPVALRVYRSMWHCTIPSWIHRTTRIRWYLRNSSSITACCHLDRAHA